MPESLYELSTICSSEETDFKAQRDKDERKRSQLRSVSPETQANRLAHIRLNSTSRVVKKNGIEGKVSLRRLRMRTLLESYAVAMAYRD